jgi:uncharacterized protein (TIGR00375 family)
MKIIADLHIHSKYSRGCSRELTLENIEKWCDYKGIGLVSTGDFTHPLWFKEIKEKLMPAEPGFYCLKESVSRVRFVVGTEISCIYTQGGRCRRIHLCLLMSSIEAAEKLIEELTKRGCNLRSDGRPIIGLSAKELARIALEIDPTCFVFPAHIWTPWFAVFGSKSGFNSLSECFEELTDKIFAVETGLSSDPKMNHQLSQLNQIALVSNSDAHSLVNLAREANIFDLPELNFAEMVAAIKSRDLKKLLATIEFFPEEGKYHVDGHAACNYSCLPAESRQNKNLCPKCGKSLILGVLNRVEELADQKEINQKDFIPYFSIIPLQEIIADSFGVGKNSKKVMAEYLKIVSVIPELEFLLDTDMEVLKKITTEEIANSIMKVRQGEVEIVPGYDGIFGQIKVKDVVVKIQNSLV